MQRLPWLSLVFALLMLSGCGSDEGPRESAMRDVAGTLGALAKGDENACDGLTEDARAELVAGVGERDCARSVAKLGRALAQRDELRDALEDPEFDLSEVEPWTPRMLDDETEHGRLRVKYVIDGFGGVVMGDLLLEHRKGNWMVDGGVLVPLEDLLADLGRPAPPKSHSQAVLG